LLLLAPVAFAQDQLVYPDTDDNDASWVNNAGTACNATTCDDDIDEAAASPDNNVLSTITTGDTTLIGFATPSSSPSTAAAAQAFEIVMSRCTEATPGVEDAGGTDPTYDLSLYCNGSSVTTLATGVTVTSLDQADKYTWQLTGACASDGSDVEAFVTVTRAGGGGNRRYPCIETIEWEVTYASASTRQRIIHVE
jgi:hypothetical protein